MNTERADGDVVTIGTKRVLAALTANCSECSNSRCCFAGARLDDLRAALDGCSAVKYLYDDGFAAVAACVLRHLRQEPPEGLMV
jgi:hypothetical protein